MIQDPDKRRRNKGQGLVRVGLGTEIKGDTNFSRIKKDRLTKRQKKKE